MDNEKEWDIGFILMIKKKHLNNVYAKYKYQKINKIQTMLKHFKNKKILSNKKFLKYTKLKSMRHIYYSFYQKKNKI